MHGSLCFCPFSDYIDLLWLGLYYMYQLAFLILPVQVLNSNSLPPASCVIVMCEQVRPGFTLSFIQWNLSSKRASLLTEKKMWLLKPCGVRWWVQSCWIIVGQENCGLARQVMSPGRFHCIVVNITRWETWCFLFETMHGKSLKKSTFVWVSEVTEWWSIGIKENPLGPGASSKKNWSLVSYWCLVIARTLSFHRLSHVSHVLIK